MQDTASDNKRKPDYVQSGFLIGIALVVIIGIGISSYQDSKKEIIPNHQPMDNICNIEVGSPEEKVTLFDINSTQEKPSLQVIYYAEDPEFWEIEHIDGNYYRVRREDREPGYYGFDEFDLGEDLIGDINKLKRYAIQHKGSQ